MLDEQCVLPADAGSAGHVGHLDEKRCFAAGQHGYATIHNSLVTIGLVRRNPHFVCVGIAAAQHSHENVLEFAVVAEQLQDRLVAGARLAYAEQILGRGIQGPNQEIVIDNDDAGIEAIEYLRRSGRIATGSFSSVGWVGS